MVREKVIFIPFELSGLETQYFWITFNLLTLISKWIYNINQAAKRFKDGRYMPLNVVGRTFKTQRVYDSLLGFRVPGPVLGPLRNLGPDSDVNSVNEPALFGYKRTSFSLCVGFHKILGFSTKS